MLYFLCMAICERKEFQMTIADIIIIAVYIVAMFGVGVYARTRIKSVDDFLVAGNRFKTFLW